MKTCKICKTSFIPQNNKYEFCFDCWKKQQRLCLKCGKIINDLPKNYKYCKECFNKKHFNYR